MQDPSPGVLVHRMRLQGLKCPWLPRLSLLPQGWEDSCFGDSVGSEEWRQAGWTGEGALPCLVSNSLDSGEATLCGTPTIFLNPGRDGEQEGRGAL